MHGNLSKIQVSSFARYKTYPSPSVEYKQVSHYPSESCLCLQRSTHRPRPALLGPDPDAGTQKGLGGRSAPGERQWPVSRRIYFLRHATRSLTSARAPRIGSYRRAQDPAGKGGLRNQSSRFALGARAAASRIDSRQFLNRHVHQSPTCEDANSTGTAWPAGARRGASSGGSTGRPRAARRDAGAAAPMTERPAGSAPAAPRRCWPWGQVSTLSR